jgi:hypothetical protein
MNCSSTWRQRNIIIDDDRSTKPPPRREVKAIKNDNDWLAHQIVCVYYITFLCECTYLCTCMCMRECISVDTCVCVCVCACVCAFDEYYELYDEGVTKYGITGWWIFIYLFIYFFFCRYCTNFFRVPRQSERQQQRPLAVSKYVIWFYFYFSSHFSTMFPKKKKINKQNKKTSHTTVRFRIHL